MSTDIPLSPLNAQQAGRNKTYAFATSKSNHKPSREIINIQVGQCGNHIGNLFWHTLVKEHQLMEDGSFTGNPNQKDSQLRLDKIRTYFREDGAMKFTPRSCMVDLESKTMDMIQASPLGSLFKPNDMCFGASGCAGGGTFAWAKKWIRIDANGAELINEVLEVIRKQTEHCDCLQGFQLMHSISSSTGGGMGTVLLTKLSDLYKRPLKTTFSVFPSHSPTDDGVESCHSLLSLHKMMESWSLTSDITHVLDNEAVYNIAHNVLKQQTPTYADLNWIISMAISGITAPLRFNCDLNGNLRTMAMNLIPFPRLQYLLCAQAPLFEAGEEKKQTLSSGELTEQLWSSHDSCDHYLAHVERGGKCLSTSVCFRSQSFASISDFGEYERYIDPAFIINSYVRQIQTYQNIPNSIRHMCAQYLPCDACKVQDKYDKSSYEFKDAMSKMKRKYKDNIWGFVPDNVQSSMVEVPLFMNDPVKMSGTVIANTTAIKCVFQRISAEFAKLYKFAKPLFSDSGIEESEWQEAHKNVRDLITEYNDKQVAIDEDRYEDSDDYDGEDDF
eukprot:17124_1